MKKNIKNIKCDGNMISEFPVERYGWLWLVVDIFSEWI